MEFDSHLEELFGVSGHQRDPTLNQPAAFGGAGSGVEAPAPVRPRRTGPVLVAMKMAERKCARVEIASPAPPRRTGPALVAMKMAERKRAREDLKKQNSTSAASTLATLGGSQKLLDCTVKGQGLGRKRKAKYYGKAELAHVLARIEALSPVPESDRVKVLLTYLAGLRPCEVAGLQRRTLHTASGEIKDQLEITGATAKRGKPRTIPMHPELRAALAELFKKYPNADRVAFSKTVGQGFQYQNAAQVSHWFSALYRGANLRGCTGMSGRRSFATNLSQYAPLQLVQQALGHATLRMTGYYVEAIGDLRAAIMQLGSEK